MSFVLESLAQRDRRLTWERRKRTLAVISSYLIVALFSASVSGALFYSLGVKHGVMEEANRPKPKPIVLQPALTIQCNKSGVEEVIRVCSARKRMEQVR